MQKLTYLAIFKALDSDDGYEACFPDLPNFVIMGATMAETLKKTKASLELHIYKMEKHGSPIPTPSATLDPDEIDNGIVKSITIFPDLIRSDLDNRRININVSIPPWLDEAAKAKNLNYSAILEASLMVYLNFKPKFTK